MDDLRSQLLTLRERVDIAVSTLSGETMKEWESTLFKAASSVGKAWSGSDLGYHAYVYYEGFQVPPPGACFSQEMGWAGAEWPFHETRGEWREFTTDEIWAEIKCRVGTERIDGLDIAKHSERVLVKCRADLVSLLEVENAVASDAFLRKALERAEGIPAVNLEVLARAQIRTGNYLTGDTRALNQGVVIAPHKMAIAKAAFPNALSANLEELNRVISDVMRYLSRRGSVRSMEKPHRIFIGHGQSSVWRDLKDFITDRLNREYDEFNRVPVAGVHNIQRLAQMLDEATFAFIVLTAEDEMADGKMQARMNVIHETGLFQGKLGFNKAIVLLEDGCEEFSNISGLTQIRFPKGNISARFEEIRRVLEREKVI